MKQTKIKSTIVLAICLIALTITTACGGRYVSSNDETKNDGLTKLLLRTQGSNLAQFDDFYIKGDEECVLSDNKDEIQSLNNVHGHEIKFDTDKKCEIIVKDEDGDLFDGSTILLQEIKNIKGDHCAFEIEAGISASDTLEDDFNALGSSEPVREIRALSQRDCDFSEKKRLCNSISDGPQANAPINELEEVEFYKFCDDIDEESETPKEVDGEDSPHIIEIDGESGTPIVVDGAESPQILEMDEESGTPIVVDNLDDLLLGPPQR